MHSDMDSFILYDAEICSPIDDKVLALEQEKIINVKSSFQIQEISVNNGILDTQGKPHETENPNLSSKQISNTPDTNFNQEILWYLEFDGSVNKLGAGPRIWIHNMENDHAEGHAYRLNFRCTNNMAEYEALLLGLKLIKSLGAVRV